MWMTYKCALLGLPFGGTAGRRMATGLAVVFCLEAVLEHLGWEIADKRVVIQGFGKVGSIVADALARRGAMVIGVCDVAGGAVDERGLDLESLRSWIAENRFIRGYPHAEPVGRRDILEVSCDVLIPAALERRIAEDHAAKIDCRVVVEAANGPTTSEADAILAGRGITVVPDVLANGGGVTVSYYEWAQDVQREHWSREQITARLQRQMRDAAYRVLAAESRGYDLRTAAQALAIERVAEASELRAIYP
jgi:glutamate dehydrogenase (NAD(P)+)